MFSFFLFRDSSLESLLGFSYSFRDSSLGFSYSFRDSSLRFVSCFVKESKKSILETNFMSQALPSFFLSHLQSHLHSFTVEGL